jgi:arylsulfatase A-like enzyme
LFRHVRPPSFDDPAFLERDLSDKPAYMAKVGHPSRDALRILFRRRIQALQAVDDAVASTVAALSESGVLANTYIFFTSDNGYLMGEHDYRGKVLAFEESLQVPLLVRGPGLPEDVVRHDTVATVDLAPTFVSIAEAQATVPMDGRNLLPVLQRPAAHGWETILVQAGPREGTPLDATGADPSGWFFRGVRTKRYTFVDYPRYRTELYDRRTDPAQLRNVAGLPKYRAVRRALARRTTVLSDCAGDSCHRTFAPVPAPH